MRKFLIILGLFLAAVVLIAMAGCSQESGVDKQVKLAQVEVQKIQAQAQLKKIEIDSIRAQADLEKVKTTQDLQEILKDTISKIWWILGALFVLLLTLIISLARSRQPTVVKQVIFVTSPDQIKQVTEVAQHELGVGIQTNRMKRRNILKK